VHEGSLTDHASASRTAGSTGLGISTSVQAAHGERPATRHDAAQAETYLGKLLYDEFGQRVHQRVGNGVVTRYGYEPLTRRLSSVYTQKPGERRLQDLHYAYDLVGNVLTLRNALGEADPSHAGEVTTVPSTTICTGWCGRTERRSRGLGRSVVVPFGNFSLARGS
jgi:hypothetical protein